MTRPSATRSNTWFDAILPRSPPFDCEVPASS
jgi:hypothetical protein